ncbi:MAG: hypothetical protein QM666_07845 [Acinetobacter sp.]
MGKQNQPKTSILQFLLLFIAGLSLLFAFIFWLITDIKPLKKQLEQVDEEATPQFQTEKVAAVPNLGVMTDQVRPLQQTTRVVASGSHSPEFRGTKFLQANLNAYSIQILYVTKEDVIRDFLDRQTSSQNFIYFRLSAENQPEHYVLNYGLYKSEQEAQNQLRQLKLDLPKSVHPKVVVLKGYSSFVNDMGMDELSNDNQLYEVRLKPAAVPKVDELQQQAIAAGLAAAARAAEAESNSTTHMTITRRDEHGNVVNVEQSRSDVPHSAASVPAANLH